jgi:hypothetical protein
MQWEQRMNTNAKHPRPTPSPLPSARKVWWLHPTAIMFYVIIPAYILLWVAGDWTRGYISTAKGFYFFKGDIAFLGLAGLLVLAIGTLSPIRPMYKSSKPSFVSPTVLKILGFLSLIGYLYWFKDFLLHPGTILNAIRYSNSFTYAIRGGIERSAGIASLAQIGLPFLVLYAHARWAGGERLLTKAHHRLSAAIIAAVIFRAFAWGERVAIIEAAIAVGFVWVSFAEIRSNVIKRLLPWLPALGSIGVIGLFAIGEYFRSWTTYYQFGKSSFWDFIFQRLTNYYFTALNTGAGQLTMLHWPTYAFEWTLRWVHKLPILGPLFTYYTGITLDGSFYFYLQSYGDPEFNNPSGLFSIFYDLGVTGGLLTCLLIGITAKYVYSIWQTSTNLTGSIYFVFLMTFVEIFRYFYLGDPRCFMVILSLMLAATFSTSPNDSKAIKKFRDIHLGPKFNKRS